MSLEINVPKEITRYEAKLIGPFTARQSIWGAIGLGASVLSYKLCNAFLPELAMGALLLAAAPCACIGFVKVYEMPFEQFAVGWIKTRFLAPSKRKSIVKNQFAIIDEEMNVEDEKKKTKYKKSKLAYQ